MTRLSIAVVGPGAIGGTVAAWLSHSPSVAAVTLCARTPLDRLEVVAPDGRVIKASPRVVTDPSEITAPVDWVLVATKAYDVAAAAAWLKPLLGAETRVAVLQNGVEHVERFTPFLDADRIVPVIVDIPAERSAPGRIHHRRDGTVTVPAGEAGETFTSLFAKSVIEASTTDDFTTVAWTKLSLNCAGAINALTRQPAGVVRKPGVADLMRAMVWECVCVGRAIGADLSDNIPDWVLERTESSPADSVNSLLGDRLAGRRMEWDARNGVIARLGTKHGIPAPLNSMAATLLSAME
ncbi:2-dehydropantoate 2-reductase [Brevundimonas sp. NIBR11]|uniref:2-dehydropantoate 2-reductase n=1 Tax=Brevundimonas sp. NIBR11 TaxID=3015999 RepID=UPI0022F0A2CC|nr:2-dehydropantoate 2-reductase [Brevundimonas sp. NIBR11]WGM30322.1 2-dehydropantoate 2-reductase [Brevundimonas sp. NIBR11]